MKSERNFNDRPTQTALDPLAGSRFVPGNSFYAGSNEGRGPVPSVQPWLMLQFGFGFPLL